MSFFRNLFGKKTSTKKSKAMTKTGRVSPEVARVLTDLKSTDQTERLVAITQAGTLLMQNSQGALEPFLVALSDKEPLIRMSTTMLFEQMEDFMLRMAVRTGEQADQLIDAFEKLPTQSERDSATSIIQRIRKIK